MATLVYMKNPKNGLMEKAYAGYSWTSLFFGYWPLAFRNEWKYFFAFLLIHMAAALFTFGIGSLVLQLIWSFLVNKWHMKRLIEKGFVIDPSQSQEVINLAKSAVGMTSTVGEQTSP
jgi:hypothetical protein